MKKGNGLDWGNIAGHISPYNIKKAVLYLRHFGVKGFWAKLTDRFEKQEIPYGEWRLSRVPTAEELARQRRLAGTLFGASAKAAPWSVSRAEADAGRDPSPLFSVIVPLYETPERYLREMIGSVCAQTYGNWELCLADASSLLPEADGGGGAATALTGIIEEYRRRDGRIRCRILGSNGGISENTNRGMEMASGDFLCFLDHDDLLEPNALYELALALKKHPGAELLYTDEDKVSADGKEFFQPNFKPDFNPFLLRSNNYICHFLAVGAPLAKRVGGFRKGFDGAQDYDFILRCTEKTEKIVHVPLALYHWRTGGGSTADNPFSKGYAYEAGQRAIEEHLKRSGLSGTVQRLRSPGFYRVRYAPAGMPKISVIIPSCDHAGLLRDCLISVWEKTTYENYEVVVVENNSTEPATAAAYRELRREAERRGKALRIVRWKGTGFHYPKLNDCGVRASDGEYLLFLNNDITVISPDWMEEFLGVAACPGVGIVGARLYYPDDTIQHAGIIIGMGGVAGSLFVGMERERSGYMNRAVLLQNLSAVTAACMLVKRSVYEELGGMERRLAVAFNDVDFCLRARRAGYQVVYDPYVELYHHESKSRGAEDTTEKLKRFQGEIEFMRGRWIGLLQEGDPYYNPNLSLKSWNCGLRQQGGK